MTNKENPEYRITTEDVVKTILTKHRINEGKFILVPELKATIGPHRIPPSEDKAPEQHIGITVITTGYSLIPAPEDIDEGLWDAAELNPKKARAPKKTD